MSNPLNFNRYSYVMNNPLKYTDPSGHAYDYENSPDDPGYDPAQSDYNPGAASDNQTNENNNDDGEADSLTHFSTSDCDEFNNEDEEDDE